MPLNGLVELWDVTVAPDVPSVTVRQCQGRFEVLAEGEVADWQAEALMEALQEWIDRRLE